MRLPSLPGIANDIRHVLTRFPLEVMIAATGTAVAMLLAQQHNSDTEEGLVRIILTCLLGLPAALACTLYAERRGLSRVVRMAVYGALVALLVVYYFSLRNIDNALHAYRFAGLALAAHAAVAVVGFLHGRQQGSGFWEFNKTLFLRICTAGIFSGVLFAGLAGALAAVDALFAVRVRERTYLQLFFAIAGIFNTVFFLAGVPRLAGGAADDATSPYPRVLRLFTQFVLVPLVSLYLLILLAYEAKIIVQWQMPKGWVCNLVLAYGVAGILTILLAHPIRHTEGNRWVRLFSQWFFALLLPLLALMLVAIGKRIGAYGFTEERYFVLMLGLWLGGMALYFLARRDRADIRIIPASLMVLGVLAVVGPLSAPAVSVRSQQGRLRRLLRDNGMMNSAGQAMPAKDSLSFEARKGLSSAIEYLVERRGLAGVQPIIATDSLKDHSRSGDYQNVQAITERLNIRYVSPWQTDDVETGYAGEYVTYHRDDHEPLDIRGYDFYLPLEPTYRDANDAVSYRYRVVQNITQRDTAYDRVEISVTDSSGQVLVGPVSVDSFFQAVLLRYDQRLSGSTKPLPNAALMLTGSGRGLEYRFVFDRLEGQRGTNAQGSGISFSGGVLIREVR